MRVLASLLLAAALSGGCAVRARPYRFSAPMLGAADVPPPWSGRPDVGHSDDRHPDDPYSDSASGGRTIHERTAPAIRVASARDVPPCGAHATSCNASSQAADAVAISAAHALDWSRLPAPNRLPADATSPGTLASATAPPVRELADLRKLVGRRDKRDSLTAALGWLHELAYGLVEHDNREAHTAQRAILDLLGWATATVANAPVTIAAAVDHARSQGHLGDPRDGISAGDLLVFERTDSEVGDDLVAIVVARDPRGVAEFVYLAGGAIRRGFVDIAHPDKRRDASGTVLNTFMRAGKRWPPKGTHYLAGELVSHVVRLH